jgi:hypothetical protein
MSWTAVLALLLILIPALAVGQGAPATKPAPPALTELEHLRVLVAQLREDRARIEVDHARAYGLLERALQQARAEIQRLQKAVMEPKPTEPKP